MVSQSLELKQHVDLDLAKRGRVGAFMYLVAVLVICSWTDQYQTHPIMAISTTLATLCIGLVRFWLVHHLSGAKKHPKNWRTYYTMNLVFTGMVWAFFSTSLSFQGLTTIQFLMVSMGTAGFGLGGAVVNAPDQRLVRLFLFSIYLPPAVICIFFLGRIAVPFGFLLLIYTLFSLSIAKSLHNEYWTLLKTNQALKKTSEDLTLASLEAEKANLAKSEFLANMSHELRTPMNGVIGMADLLVDSNIQGQAREFAHIIRSSGEQLLTVINDILDYSKLEAGKLELDIEGFDPRLELHKTMEMVAQQAHEKGLELVFLPAPNLPRGILGDPARIKQIGLNMLTNAIKFTTTGEVILLVDWQETENSSAMIIQISDTGIGMDHDQCRKVFNPFTQADGSTTRRFGGTGLGLSIVQSLVNAMEGTIDVESIPNQGTCFTISLPLQQTPSQDPRFDPKIPADLPKVAIMTSHRPTHLALELCLGQPVEILKTLGGDQGPRLVFLDDPNLESEVSDLDPETRLINLCCWTVNDSATPQANPTPILRKPFSEYTVGIAISEALDRGFGIKPTGRSAKAKTTGANELSILVAEDNAFNQKVILYLLSKMGCEVHIVFNGQEAVEALENQQFDAILMDCQMPVMDGYLAARTIRTLETQASRTPIIALTANALNGDEAKCYAAGMDAFLSKPIKKESLAKTFAELGLLTLETVES